MHCRWMWRAACGNSKREIIIVERKAEQNNAKRLQDMGQSKGKRQLKENAELTRKMKRRLVEVTQWAYDVVSTLYYG